MQIANKGFTLIELTITIFIISIITIGVSLSINKIGDNMANSTIEQEIFGDIKNFIIDKSLVTYNSGIVFTGGILIYNDKNGYLIGSFLDDNNGINYKFNYNKDLYDRYYFGFLTLDTATLTGILANTGSIINKNFNTGKIYKKLLIKDIDIKSFNTGALFEIDLNIFKKENSNLFKTLKIDNQVLIDDYLKFNLDI
ncbi:prepilin-type N-terminal cleavage/methylation domain-containing protein [Candidatus Gracilibacteria bacterium]|nr:prepilin-type N-terminal cleavage/methylation domain-containing protein [Candidatus Gracilibacteria bacterium]